MSNDARKFLTALFDTVPEELWAYIWTKETRQRGEKKKTHWRQAGDIDGMVAVVEQHIDIADVYVGCAVAKKKGKPIQRLTVDDPLAAGIMGFWADIDIADLDAHKQYNLPPTVDAAKELLRSAGLWPNVLVHSGHGLQAWWLFNEFWDFESDGERAAAQRLSRAWNATLKYRAAERNWKVDSTFDLSRVFRVPGSKNFKAEPIAPCDLLEVSKGRFGLDDIEEHLIDEETAKTLNISVTRKYIVAGDLTFDSEASPPFEKFEVLRDNEPRFAATWERTRKDFKDQSPSSYDLSLASFAVAAGWTDQEIADLISASHRKHKDDKGKSTRPDYIRRTISKAHDTIASAEGIEQMEEVTETIQEAQATGDDEEIRHSRRAATESLSQQLKMEVFGVNKLNTVPPQYQFRLPNGLVDLGSTKDLMSWTMTASKIADATNHMIPRFKQAVWDKIVQTILMVSEEFDTGMESSDAGRAHLWIEEFLMNRPPTDDKDSAVSTEYPFVDGAGNVFVFGNSLIRFLWISRGERVVQRDVARMLHAYGATNIKMPFEIDGRRTTRSVWRLPSSRDDFNG